jgi:hypothetical protein
MLQTGYAHKVPCCTLSLEWLNNSEGEVRTSKTVPEVGSRQIFEIREQLQKHINWWLTYRRMTLELMEDQRNTNRETIRQTDHEDLEKTNIRAKCVWHSPKAEQKAQELNNMWRLQPDLWDQSTLSQMHPYWEWLSGISEWFWNQTSQRAGTWCLCLQGGRYRPTLKMTAVASYNTLTPLSQTTLCQIL